MYAFYEVAHNRLFAETTTSYQCNQDVKSWITQLHIAQMIRDPSYIVIGGGKKSQGYLSPKSLESQKIREVRDGESIYIENYLNFRIFDIECVVNWCAQNQAINLLQLSSRRQHAMNAETLILLLIHYYSRIRLHQVFLQSRLSSPSSFLHKSL